jgi:hypothetical protein
LLLKTQKLTIHNSKNCYIDSVIETFQVNQN